MNNIAAFNQKRHLYKLIMLLGGHSLLLLPGTEHEKRCRFGEADKHLHTIMIMKVYLNLLIGATILVTNIHVTGFCIVSHMHSHTVQMSKVVLRMNDNKDIVSETPEPVQMQAPQVEADEVDIGTYVFGKSGELRKDMKLTGIDPVRFISYNLLALVLALGANFMGITSLLMSNTYPNYFRSLSLDQLYEVGGYRRYSSQEQKYQFLYPSTWEPDRAVLAQKLRMAETPNAIKRELKILFLM